MQMERELEEEENVQKDYVEANHAFLSSSFAPKLPIAALSGFFF